MGWGNSPTLIHYLIGGIKMPILYNDILYRFDKYERKMGYEPYELRAHFYHVEDHTNENEMIDELIIDVNLFSEVDLEGISKERVYYNCMYDSSAMIIKIILHELGLDDIKVTVRIRMCEMTKQQNPKASNKCINVLYEIYEETYDIHYALMHNKLSDIPIANYIRTLAMYASPDYFMEELEYVQKCKFYDKAVTDIIKFNMIDIGKIKQIENRMMLIRLMGMKNFNNESRL